MIYATVNLTIGTYKSTCDSEIVLYRGDKNVEIRFVMKGNKFTVLDSTYAQMIIKRPSATPIFSKPALIQNNTVVLTITEDMIDEMGELGTYTFQIRLYDTDMNASVTLPPCESALIVERPIAIDGESAVNLAVVNASEVISANAISEDEIFNEDNSYNKTIWADGDLITDARLNKIEDALFYINEKGGGGSATAPYISTSLDENVLVGVGQNFDLHLDFSSPNLGKGTLKVFINDVDSMSIKIDQGETVTAIPGELFIKGTNQVVVYVLDRVGMMSNSLTFYARYGSTEISSTFDPYISYDYGSTIRYYFTPIALDTSKTLTFNMTIDGQLQGTVACISDTRSYFTFPTTLEVGNHYCEAWVTDGTTDSNKLRFNLIIIDNTSLVVASDTRNPIIEEGEQLVLDYKVYMKNNSSFIVKTYVDNVMVNTGVCGLDFNYYRTSSLAQGTHTVKVEVYDVTETYSDYIVWTITVTESTYEMLNPVSAGSLFIASAKNRTNTDANRDKLIGVNQDGQKIEALLSNFTFNNENGWVDDTLIISGNSWVDIPIQPLADNAKYGFTLDVEFSTKPIGVENAEVLTLWNEEKNCGIKITTEELILRSAEGNQCDLYFTEDEFVSAIFVIDRNEKMAKIYLNGVMCEAFALSDYEVEGVRYLEDFTVNSNLYLGGYNKNGYSEIKNIRVYEVALATDEIINNFISNKQVKSEQRALVEFQKGNTLPTLTVYCDFSGLGKDDKKPCNIVYNSPDENLYGKSFTLGNKTSQLQYQGTSSMAYPIKNYRLNLRDENGEKWKYNPFSSGQPEARFTLKADFMSSGHWQNTGLAKWVNDNLYHYKTNDEKSMNPSKWYDVQNEIPMSAHREAINGFPCRLILVNDGETPLNEGQYEPTPGNTKDMGVFNFNNDKDNVATLGFDSDIWPNCASFEVTANSDTSAGAFMSFGRVSGQWMENLFVTGAKISYNANYSGLTAIKVNPGEKYHIVRIGGTLLRVAIFSELPYDGLVGSGRVSGDDTEYTITIPDGYSYMAIYTGPEGKPEDIKIYNETSYSESDELAYLKESFELRHPDADDVAEDWGFMGVETEVNKFDYYIQGETTTCTTRITKGYFGTDVITSPNLRDIVCYDSTGASSVVTATNGVGTLKDTAEYFRLRWDNITSTTFTINEIEYHLGSVSDSTTIKDPYVENGFNTSYGLKALIDWVDNCTDEEFVADFEEHFHKDYTLRYYLLVITLGMVDNLGKNMMLDTWDCKIWMPRFYDMDTICSYDNSGQIKFDVDIEMEQGYWNTSASRLWTRIRDLMHDDLVEIYKDMRANGMSYESFMNYFYGQQISQIPQKYYNMDADVKYLPFADEYIGKAHGDGYEHLKRWLKKRLIFTDTLFDYAPSYNNDILTIRANTTEEMTIEIETYTPVYQHVSWYNGQMDKKKIDGKVSVTFSGKAQAATDQEVLIYGGTNIKRIKGLSSMNPNQMLIGGATRLIELEATNCPLLVDINSNKANLSPHTYLNKVDLSGCSQLGGTLRLNNSPLIQEINMSGTAITNMILPSSIRNLESMKLPNGISSLTLNDAGMLNTLEFDEGVKMQSVAMSNCNALTNVVNFDLLNTPTVSLNNSYTTAAELYFRDTTNLTLRNMPNLERVIFTPNNEYETFELINVANAPDYKVTTFNCPKLSTFMTTAPYRESYNVGGYVDREVEAFIDTILVENYKPQGDTFNYNLSEYNSANDFIFASIDVAGCSSVSNGENILSIGQNLTDWYDDSTLHFYYQKNSNTLRIDMDNRVLNTINNVSNPINIELNKNGLFINDTKVSGIDNILQLTSLNIGSCEGVNRSNATYNYIKLSVKGMTTIQVKDYGDIQPNTTFTANNLDISSTQFTDVKLLCTTDTNTLKLPTTVKNFYCDSSFDLDTDYLEDGEYDVVHGELVEPYTTDYEGGVCRYIDVTTTIDDTAGKTQYLAIPDLGGIFGYDERGFSKTSSSWNNSYWISELYPTKPGSVATISGSSSLVDIGFCDENQILIARHSSTSNGTSLSAIAPANAAYVVFGGNYIWSENTIVYQQSYTPNLIPSSADGSLIFSMYAPSNAVAPASGTWDLKGLEFDNFHTFGMNNDVKPEYEVIELRNNATIYRVLDNRYAGNPLYDLGDYPNTYTAGCVISPILLDDDITRITITTSNGLSMFHYNSTDYDGVTATTQGFSGGSTQSGEARNVDSKTRLRLITFLDTDLEWFDMTLVGTETKTIRYYMDDMIIVDIDDERRKTWSTISYNEILSTTPISLSMPARYDDYNITIKNANISPKTHNTMLYPLLVNEDNPITGTLDYTNYAGKHLSWSFAYTDEEHVNITQPKDELLNSYEYKYNAFYDTEFEFDNPNEIARYTSSASGVLPGFNTEFTGYTTGETDNGDGTYTVSIITDSLDNLPTKINFTSNNNLLTVDKLNTSKVTTMFQMFRSCGNLTAINCILDTSSVTNEISQIFIGCVNLEYVDVTNLVGSNIKYASGLFSGCTLLKQIDGLNTWDTSELTSLTSMFNACNALESLSGIERWNVGKVRAMDQFVYKCTSLAVELDLSNWDISNCTNFASAFRETGLTEINLTNWNPTKTNTNMAEMFRNSSSMNKLIAPNLVNANVSGLRYFLYECSSLTSLDVSQWNVSGSTDLSYMFGGCSKLTSLDLSNWDVSGATSLGGFLNNCALLADLKTNFILNKASLNGFMYGCRSLMDLSNVKLSGTVTTVNGFAFGMMVTSLDLSTLDCTYETDGMDIYTIMNSNIVEFYPPTNISQSINFRYENKISIDSIVRIFNNLITTMETRTIMLSAIMVNKLTEDQIAIATNKGWTVTTP